MFNPFLVKFLMSSYSSFCCAGVMFFILCNVLENSNTIFCLTLTGTKTGHYEGTIFKAD